MFARLSEAFRLFGANLYVILALVLSLWLPCNALVSWIDSTYFDPDDFRAVFHLSSLTSALLGPLVDAALFSAILLFKQNVQPTYAAALSSGFRLWFPMFATYFVVNLVASLALLLLIVPGVILFLRYALVGPIVVVEGLRVSAAMNRSKELTYGHKWWMCGAFLLLFLIIMVVGFAVAMPFWLILEFFPLPEPLSSLIAGLTEIIFDLGSVLFSIFLFICYCDFSGLEFQQGDSTLEVETAEAVWEARTGEVPEDPNPYRSPRFNE